MNNAKNLFLLAFLLLLGTASLRASDLFEVKATATDGTTKTINGKNLPDLIKNLINTQDDFAVFSGKGLTASLKYGGVENALSVTLSADGKTARIQSSVSGLDQTFNGTSRSDTESKVTDYLKKSGATELSKFLKEINKKSMVAVSDGNPNASTAFFASQVYNSYARSAGETYEEKETIKSPRNGVAFRISAEMGMIDTKDFQGTAYTVPIAIPIRIAERVGLRFDLPLQYLDIEGSKTFSIGANLGIPVKIIKRTDTMPVSWQLTPSGGAIGSGSYDLLAGGFLWQLGISSLVSWEMPFLTLSMGNQFTYAEGIPLSFGDYEFDPGVKQEIVKNGLQVSVPFARRWVVDVYGVYSQFLETAAIDQYYTFGADIVYRFLGKADAEKKKNGYARLGVYADMAEDYTATYGVLGLGWKF